MRCCEPEFSYLLTLRKYGPLRRNIEYQPRVEDIRFFLFAHRPWQVGQIVRGG